MYITNTDEQITILPAVLTNGEAYSRVILLDIDGEIQSVVYSMYSFNDYSTDTFYGEVLITDLEGSFINRFKVENSLLVAQYVPNTGHSDNTTMRSTDCDCPWACDMCLLDEVVINASPVELGNLYTSIVPESYDYTYEITDIPGGGGGGNGNGLNDVSCTNGQVLNDYGHCINPEDVCSDGLILDENGDCLEHISCGDNLELNSSGECIEEDEFEYPFVHCSTFEYLNGQNGLVKSAAVANINNLFTTYRGSGFNVEYRGVNIALPIIYFNMPPVWTNGAAATASALALGEAIDLTDDYLDANPYVNLFELEQIFIQNINSSMNSIGGTASRVPSFEIPNLSNYTTSLISNGNCN